MTNADSINKMIDDMKKTIREMEEKKIAKALKENDFFVGDWNVAQKIKEAFPDANVIVDPWVIEQNKIIMVKKADLYPCLKFGEVSEL